MYTAANAALGPALQQLRADAAAAGDSARAAALKAGKSAADADAAARAAQVDALRRETAALLDRYPAIRETGVPSLENPRFVNALLFHSDGSVKAPFRQLFPRPGATLMVVRLSEDASLTTVRAVREGVTSMLKRYPLTGVGITVSGAPVVSEGLVNATVTDLRVVLPVAAVVMLVILVASLPGWLGLLPLPVAALGAAYTYGALDLLRHPTTLAAIAAAPILSAWSPTTWSSSPPVERRRRDRCRAGSRCGCAPWCSPRRRRRRARSSCCSRRSRSSARSAPSSPSAWPAG